MSEWRPIAEAPKDCVILLWDGETIGAAAWEWINIPKTLGWWRYWAGPEEAVFDVWGASPICENPTHFMPLPPPPQETENE